jgi:hypothetical protein
MQKHFTVLGALYVAWSLLHLLAGAVLFGVFAGGGLLLGHPRATVWGATLGTILGVIFVVKAVPELIGGIGLLKGKSWARILLLILGCLNLLHFPLGTALGIYTIWGLTRPEAEATLAGMQK